jgi:3-isopropylmalate/(R)-2-methylmalate dehydratase small subunit
LPIVVPARDHAALVRSCTLDVPCVARIDVAAGTISGQDGTMVRFELDERKRQMLLTGLDEIAATLASAERIEAFRARHRKARPWLYDPLARGGTS